MQGKDIHQRIVTLKSRNAEIVVNKVIPTRYAGHPKRLKPAHGKESLQSRPTQKSTDQKTNLFGLFTVNGKVNSSILVDLSIDGTPITMTLDTGASVSIISEKTHQTQLPHLQLSSSGLLLRTYTLELKI